MFFVSVSASSDIIHRWDVTNKYSRAEYNVTLYFSCVSVVHCPRQKRGGEELNRNRNEAISSIQTPIRYCT